MRPHISTKPLSLIIIRGESFIPIQAQTRKPGAFLFLGGNAQTFKDSTAYYLNEDLRLFWQQLSKDENNSFLKKELYSDAERLEYEVGHIGYVDGEQCNALLAADHSSSEDVAKDKEEEDSDQHHQIVQQLYTCWYQGRDRGRGAEDEEDVEDAAPHDVADGQVWLTLDGCHDRCG